MARNATVEHEAMLARDQPRASAMGSRKTPKDISMPIPTQPTRAPVATITQPQKIFILKVPRVISTEVTVKLAQAKPLPDAVIRHFQYARLLRARCFIDNTGAKRFPFPRQFSRPIPASRPAGAPVVAPHAP